MIKGDIALAFLVAASTLFGLGLTAYATDNQQTIAALNVAGETLDEALLDKVDTLLRTDVGLAGSKFHVQAKTGVVTLGGTVPDEHSLRRALDLASSVRGVREVRNALEIDFPK